MYGVPPHNPASTDKVLAVYHRYWQLLEDGKAQYIYPNPEYQWRWFQVKGDVTIERLRTGLAGIDGYLAQPGQWNWAKNNRHEVYTKPPEMSRLPDAALLAMFQELDAIYAESEGA